MSNFVAPYIGITGFIRPQQITDCGYGNPNRQIMIGLLLDQKTLGGEANDSPGIYPRSYNIPELLLWIERNGCFGLVHYSTTEPDSLAEQLLHFLSNPYLKQAGDKFQGFQYNLLWPSAKSLWQVHDDFEAWYGPVSRHVLALGPRALNCATAEVVHRLEGYFDAGRKAFPFASVLIDMSEGRGLELDWDRAYTLIEALLPLTRHPFNLKLGVAGGLSAENLHNLAPLIELYPELSIDAEGRLQDGIGELDPEKVESYLRAAYELLL